MTMILTDNKKNLRKYYDSEKGLERDQCRRKQGVEKNSSWASSNIIVLLLPRHLRSPLILLKAN